MSDLFKNLRSYDKTKPQEVIEVGGILGLPVNSQTVQVPGRNAYVYVRIRNSSEIVQAFNDKVTPVYNLPILMVWDRGGYRITGRDIKRYSNWGSNYSYLPRHGGQHSFYGGDATFIYSQQFVPLLAMPSGSSGAGMIYVEPHVYRNPNDGTWSHIGNQHSANILVSKPTNNLARMMLLYWDLDSESVEISSGSTFAATITGTAGILPYLPPITSQKQIAIAGVRLVSGTADVSWDNLYDLRQFTTTTPGAFEGGFGAQDEGVVLGTGTILNFVGNNINASISGSVIRVFVTGSTSGGNLPYAYLRDQKTSGTDGGPIVANTWTKRDLTNIISDDDGIVSSLSSGTFLLDAGTYRIHATAPSFTTNATRIILWDYASSAMLLLGKTSYINGGGNASLVGQFTLTGSSYLQILEIAEFGDEATWQLGANMHDRASNDSYYEIYTEVELWKMT